MHNATAQAEPLSAFPQIRTSDLDALAESVKRYYGPVAIKRPNRQGRLNVLVNHWQMQGVGLTYARHGAAVDVTVGSFNFYAQLYSFRGAAIVAVGRNRVDVDSLGSFVANPRDSITLSYAPTFEKIILKLDENAVGKKCEALTGRALTAPLRFERSALLKPTEARLLADAVMHLVRRLDTLRDGIHPKVATELADAMLVNFLISNVSNYTQYLKGRPTSAGVQELRAAEEYIEANWDQPITMEALTAVAGVSARSLYYSFRKLRGYSPKSFVTQLRLRKSYELLARPESSTTVTDVALACGFGNLGHFATYYRTAFGETPSASLRRARSGTRSRKSLPS
jgi:AraC-like DNA-binding protein